MALKVEILDRLKMGEGATSVGRYYNLNEATVRTIKKNEENIRARAAAGFVFDTRCPPRVKPKRKEEQFPVCHDRNGDGS